MGKCVVKVCDSSSQKHNKSSGITFHKIPYDEARREIWVKRIRLLRKETDWVPTKFTVICSKHFRDQHKLESKKNVVLSNDAVPMIADDSQDDSDNTAEFKVEKHTDEEIDDITERLRDHKMRKIIQRLKIICTRRLRKIKNLLQKNKRLIIKNKKFKNVIEELKHKRMLSEEEEMECNS